MLEAHFYVTFLKLYNSNFLTKGEGHVKMSKKAYSLKELNFTFKT